ncbi:Hsp70 family protein [Streptomyces virginiae]|uniref:Hsp70 family protein n=1 Tax=Streptomyces virginiae TaxID=1961 RepID=UPI00364A657D
MAGLRRWPVQPDALTRKQFERLGRADFRARFEALLPTVLEDGGVTVEDFDHVILSGGVARTPFVVDEIGQAVGGKQLENSIGPSSPPWARRRSATPPARTTTPRAPQMVSTRPPDPL